jgi:hypothetical protein
MGDFIVTFPYIHILYPDLVHPLHYSPSYPILIFLFKITSIGFHVPYSYLYRKYTVGQGRRGGGKGEEMTQTLYAHMNKRKRKKESTSAIFTLLYLFPLPSPSH